MNAVINYPGSKTMLAPWICSQMPEHKTYLEPFAGSLAVLFAKERSRIETVNDLNGEVVHFFRMLRERPDELVRQITLTPYSRAEYDTAYEKTEDDIERARRFCVRSWMGFAGANKWRNGFRCGMLDHSHNPAKSWQYLPETMKLAAERLQGVQIENLPAQELIRRYNTKDVFIYADPPYLTDTRRENLYACEMTEEDHVELLELLLTHPGKVMISGYDNELYDHLLSGWNKVHTTTKAHGGQDRVETLWMNYEAGQISLFQ